MVEERSGRNRVGELWKKLRIEGRRRLLKNEAQRLMRGRSGSGIGGGRTEWKGVGAWENCGKSYESGEGGGYTEE